MHVLFLLADIVVMGASQAFPQLPFWLGQIMFWGGLAGLFAYFAWFVVRPFRYSLWPLVETVVGPLTRRTRMLLAVALIAIGTAILALGIVMLREDWSAQGKVSPDILAIKSQLKFVDPLFRRDIREEGGKKTLERVQISIVIRNDAQSDIQYAINNFDLRVLEKVPEKKTEYPSKGPVMQPGQVITYEGPKVELGGVPCDKVLGTFSTDIAYGPPGQLVHHLKPAMRFTITLDENCNSTKQEWSWVVDKE